MVEPDQGLAVCNRAICPSIQAAEEVDIQETWHRLQGPSSCRQVASAHWQASRGSHHFNIRPKPRKGAEASPRAAQATVVFDFQSRLPLHVEQHIFCTQHQGIEPCHALGSLKQNHLHLLRIMTEKMTEENTEEHGWLF